MEQIIYADILFLIDLTMDFLALYITASILKIKFKSSVCILSAVLGAVFSVFSVISRSQSIILTIAVSAVMCLIAFFGNNIKSLIKTVLVFYTVNMLLGGVMTLVFNAFNKITESEKELLIYGEVSTVGDNIPIIVFFMSVGLVFIIFKLVSRALNSRPTKRVLEILLTHEGKTVKLLALEDSGNKVCEPMSNEPIIFMKEKNVFKLGGERLVSALSMKNEYFSGKDKHRYRVVFYQTVSGSDMCVCFKPQSIKINGKLCSAWVALGKNINSENIDCIIPSTLLI
ncbi:MAG: sigma-E processing peptidase SpoIIGA [Clostridia bacterium]|nr:sigma-E processing peptidase SpoIIGA [Clostridia bacterium]